jgi:hypothetical protein
MENSIINTSVMPTKANIEKVAQSILQPIQDGYMSAPEVAVRIKFLEDVLKKVKSELEVKENDVVLGAKIEIVEAGVKYAYQDCDLWREIKNKLLPLEEELKKIEEQIKIATKIGKSFVDESTGEIISPVQKTSTTSYKITLEK